MLTCLSSSVGCMAILNAMSRMVLPPALIALSGSGWGQPGGSPPAALSGTVVDSVTGEPIARALVQAGIGHAALTDQEGRFSFENIDEDSVFVSKPGYFSPEGSSATHSTPITLKLIPEAILFGAVLDPNGQPIQDLTVQLKVLQVRAGRQHWEPAHATTTNAEGEFRFADLKAGKYLLSSGFKIDGLPEAASSVAFVPVVFPPLAGDGIGGALTLLPDQHIEADLAPPSEKLYPVSGLVSGPFAQGVAFDIRTREGEPVSPPVRFYPSGAFRAMLPSGAYAFHLRSTVGRLQNAGIAEISVNHAPVEGVSITLAPLPTLPLEVEFQSTNVTSQNPPPSPAALNLFLQKDDAIGRSQLFVAQPRQSVDLRVNQGGAPLPEGPLIFQDVEPGHYTMQVQPQAPWYVASAACGNVDMTRETLFIAAGAAACTVHVVLRDDSASLKWTIVPGSAQPRGAPVFITALPLDNLTQYPQSANATLKEAGSSSAAQGSFDFLAPGRYLVVALPHPQEIPYRDSEALQRYLTLGQEVTLARGGKVDVQLQLQPGEP